MQEAARLTAKTGTTCYYIFHAGRQGVFGAERLCGVFKEDRCGRRTGLITRPDICNVWAHL
jgi:hypothetical protein